VWTETLNKSQGFTFFNKSPLSAARLDRFYVSSLSEPFIQSAETKVSFSDHLTLNVKYKSTQNKYVPPYWRFNNDLLFDQNYTDLINNYIDYKQNTFKTDTDHVKEWELLKQDIKQLTITYTIDKTKNMQEDLNNLNQILISADTSTNTNINEKIETNETAKEIYQNLTERKLKSNQLEALYKTDKPTARDITHKLQKRTINGLIYEGQLTHNKQKIKEAVLKHLTNIFNTKDSVSDPREYLNSTTKTLKQTDQRILEKRITKDELTHALKSLNKNKSPGIDGLTVEFLVHFWNKLGDLYFKMVNEALSRNEFPKSLRMGVITLIYKKGDPSEIKNWRPVTVPTADYKIFARSLSNRIKTVVEKLVSSDQSFCVPNRSIFDTLHLTRDVISYANEKSHPLAIVSLDQAGAFDRVDREYLFNLLEAFGFPNNIITGIKLLYTKATAVAKINNQLTSEIPLTRGVRQGCPLSGLLFALSIEPLLADLRVKLKGFNLPLPNK
jgi:hypothetical protein